MVVRNSVTFSVTRIGGQVDRSKALNHPGWTQLMLPNSETVRRTSSVHHNWSLLKSDRFSLQNTLPVSIMVGPLALEVDHIGFATPTGSQISPLAKSRPRRVMTTYGVPT